MEGKGEDAKIVLQSATLEVDDRRKVVVVTDLKN